MFVIARLYKIFRQTNVRTDLRTATSLSSLHVSLLKKKKGRKREFSHPSRVWLFLCSALSVRDPPEAAIIGVSKDGKAATYDRAGPRTKGVLVLLDAYSLMAAAFRPIHKERRTLRVACEKPRTTVRRKKERERKQDKKFDETGWSEWKRWCYVGRISMSREKSSLARQLNKDEAESE